nr:hypothetical protein CFP56_73574 [Quercus suber]
MDTSEKTGQVLGPKRLKWRLTGFYRQPDTSRREETWTLLESLKHSNNLLWLCLGDYNEIISQAEKSGGSLRPARQMDRFREVIHHCGFIDLGYTGSPFTWSRNHPVDGRTYIRLDRALATIAWKSLFQNTVVQHVPTSASDHSMLVVILSSIRCRRPKFHAPFRFEAMWLRDPRCAEVVQDAWMEGLYKTEGTQITNCLDSCRDRLTSWNKLEFGHVGRQITRLEQELQALDHQPQQNLERIQEVHKALDCWAYGRPMTTQWNRLLWITSPIFFTPMVPQTLRQLLQQSGQLLLTP